MGATLIGDREGVSGRNNAVCEMVFTALQDGMLSELDLTLSRVNVVQSDLEYLEDIEGWSFKLSVRDAEEE